MSGKIYWCQLESKKFYEHRLLYQLPHGRIAFGVDELGNKSLLALLRGAVGWDYKQNKWIVCKDFGFIEDVRKLEGSGSIVSFYDFEREDFADDIPSMSHTLSRIKSLNENEKKEVVQKALDHFDAVAVWDLDYRANVFSKDKASFLSFLERLPQEVEIIEVEEESKMPVW